jgi:hypothetical protein
MRGVCCEKFRNKTDSRIFVPADTAMGGSQTAQPIVVKPWLRGLIHGGFDLGDFASSGNSGVPRIIRGSLRLNELQSEEIKCHRF